MRNPSKRIWFGSEEPIFDALPANVIANFRTPRSENALLWNSIYQLAQPAIKLQALLGLRPLWGTRTGFAQTEDDLAPYFWGFSVDAERLGGLDKALDDVDGSGPKTEVDLFLKGDHHLIAVEAKHTSGFGRCARYQQGRCPEIHSNTPEDLCRYWQPGGAEFSNLLRMGPRPALGSDTPPCSRHYQLSRTMLIGQHVARQHGLTFSIWSIVSQRGWDGLEKDWLDFTARVRDSEHWRRMRVLSWEALNRLPNHGA